MNATCILKGHDFMVVSNMIAVETGKPIAENLGAEVCRRCGSGMKELLEALAKAQGLEGKITNVKYKQTKP